MADWDDEDFEPGELVQTNVPPGIGDKWAGEDVEEDLKDAWDDEDDVKDSGDDASEQKAVQVKKKKPLKERIAEKEAKRKADAVEKQRKEEEARKEQTAEDILAEKLRRQKLQEDADLELAKEAFGVDGSQPARGVIDSMEPSSIEDFEKFAEVLRDKITKFESSIHYVSFLDKLYRELAVGVEPEDLKKLGSTLNTLANEKAKAQKGTKGKKGKQKAKLNVGKSDNKVGDFEDDFGAEFDDFL